MAKWWKYIINPVGALAQDLAKDSKSGSFGKAIEGLLNPGDTLVQALSGDKYHDLGDITNEGISNAWNFMTKGEGADAVSKVWNDITGKSQQEEQNQFNREMAEEEYQRNLQAIGDTAAAYDAAGFNRNLMYSKDGVSYQAPQLQAYSGSAKIDNILSRVGKIISTIPAIYQATAALEGIDQARERTKQSEIKTMSMGMSLLDQGYKLGDTQITHPFAPNLERDWFSSKRHIRDFTEMDSRLPIFKFGNEYSKYADAALKNKFDLLNSIGIKNQMNSTLNNWRGYQYSLDRRFGAAGRIVGLGSQGLGAAAKLFTPIKLFGK